MFDSTPSLIPLYKHMRLIGYALVDADDEAFLSRGRWTLNHQGYAVATTAAVFDGEVLMHRIISKPHTDLVVDHINGVRTDNRKINLRNCTHAQNSANISLIRNKSGYRGVFLDKRDGRWSAAITHHGQTVALGTFPDAEHAALAFDSAARQLKGEYAVLNFPEREEYTDIDWVEWQKERQRTHSGQRKLSFDEADEIRARFERGARPVALAAEFSVSPACIHNIVSGKSYTRPYAEEGTEKALERVAAGEAITAVAKDMGLSLFRLRRAARAKWGLIPAPTKKRRRSTARLTQENVDEIRRRAAAGERQIELAEEFGVSPTTINNYVRFRVRKARAKKD